MHIFQFEKITVIHTYCSKKNNKMHLFKINESASKDHSETIIVTLYSAKKLMTNDMEKVRQL